MLLKFIQRLSGAIPRAGVPRFYKQFNHILVIYMVLSENNRKQTKKITKTTTTKNAIGIQALT